MHLWRQMKEWYNSETFNSDKAYQWHHVEFDRNETCLWSCSFSVKKNGFTKQLPKQSQDKCSPAALLWLLLFIMHKFLELSMGYGWCPSFILLAFTQLSKDLPASDGLSLFWFKAMPLILLQQHGNKQKAPRQVSSQPAQRIIHGNVYLCYTHNSMCDQRAGARPPTTQCGCLQPAEAIIMMRLLQQCLKGGWCQAHTMLSSSHGWQEGHKSLCNSSCITEDWVQPSVFLDRKLSWNTFHYTRQFALITSKQVCVGRQVCEVKAAIESQNQLGWEKPLGSWSPAFGHHHVN